MLNGKPMSQKTKILIIAGEASGDRHAADLVAALKKELPSAEFSGIGGDHLAAQGVHLLYHIREMAFLGFTEVIRHLPFIRRVFRHLKTWMQQEKPRAVILIDYPGFNLKLAKLARQLNIPVIYYICPQLWAWGEGRVKKIQKYVDLPLVIFKFEETFYARRGIRAHFVGNPLVDQLQVTMGEAEFRRRYHLSGDKKIMALLPGSRLNEVRHLLPLMLESYRQFRDREQFEWVIGKSDTIGTDVYREFLADVPEIRMVEGHIHGLMRYAYLALVASGTATLEIGYFQTPMIVLYRVSPLTYFIGKQLVKIDKIALANIVCDKHVVPELIQDQARPEKIVALIDKYVRDANYYQNVRRELGRIREVLGPAGASLRAARMIAEFLHAHPRHAPAPLLPPDEAG